MLLGLQEVGLIYLLKKLSMHKFLILLFLGFLMISCDSDKDQGEFVVGANYLALKNKVIAIDTVTVNVSTIKLDSLVTSNGSRILVGNYDDPLFGKVKADGYFQLSTSSFSIKQNSDLESSGYVFDSIAMILKYDDYYYADTTKVQTLSIHRVLAKFKTNAEDKSFYNSSGLNYSNESLGTISYKPQPINQDSIRIKLNNEFGLELFNKFKNNEITSYEEFTDYLKGFAVTSGSSASNSIIGFNLLSVLRLYYSKGKGDTDNSYTMDFAISDATKQFNAISSDRSGTLIQDLPLSKMNLSSSFTGNKGFIQSGAGIVMRVDFPYIKQLKYLSEKGAIVDAQLIMKPVKNSYSKMFSLPENLTVYVADKLNRIKTQLVNSSNENLSATLYNGNDELDETVGYKLSVGSFLQKEMIKESDSKSGLIFTLPDLSKVVNRLVLGDQINKENQMKLQIYYITY
jgi:hypothetical protein